MAGRKMTEAPEARVAEGSAATEKKGEDSAAAVTEDAGSASGSAVAGSGSVAEARRERVDSVARQERAAAVER